MEAVNLRVERQPVQEAYARLRRAYQAQPFPSAAEREDRLERLERLLVEHREALAEAVSADFGGRSRHESLLADLLLTLDGAREARRQVRAWMEPRPAEAHRFFRPARAWVESLPKGVVGIIAPWNYPVNLALAPLSGALAAGCRVLLKPSEITPRTSALLGRLVRDAFTAEEVAVVEGGPEVAQAVTRLPLDHLFFTGSTQVGRAVASAAAEQLTPVTLELGGKSPALVHPDYPVARAGERVALGKLFNAGQTCIAPDYVLLAEGREEAFAAAFRDQAARAYPELLRNEQYTAIVSERHLARLQAVLDDARAKGARLEVVAPGGGVVSGRRLAPVLAFGVTPEMRLMQEELFGPILPVRTYRVLDDALAEIRSRPRPLAFYYFDEDERRAQGVLQQVVSGGACLNDTLVHFAQENLPFGGVGGSGMGAYHGRAGFEAFSHARGVLAASALSPARQVQAPPYGRVLDATLDLLFDGARRLPGVRLLRDLAGR